MTVRTEVKVRGYHLDMFRHVNNARYLEFLEEGRWAFFDEHPQFFYRLQGVNFLVVNININYRATAALGEVLEVGTRLSKIGNTSGVMHQEIHNRDTGKFVVDADVTFVMTDAATGKPLSLEHLLRDVLDGLLQ